jgi:hypothetical protein
MMEKQEAESNFLSARRDRTQTVVLSADAKTGSRSR